MSVLPESGLGLKTKAVRAHFGKAIGATLERYQTAEILLDDGSWSPWPDLPIRLYANSGMVISISWSNFDDLWITNDLSLPFAPEDSTFRWIESSIDMLDRLLGATIDSVHIGRGQLAIEGQELEIWTRLLIQLGKCWLEIYNALDENGYEVHSEMPSGEFINCC